MLGVSPKGVTHGPQCELFVSLVLELVACSPRGFDLLIFFIALVDDQGQGRDSGETLGEVDGNLLFASDENSTQSGTRKGWFPKL